MQKVIAKNKHFTATRYSYGNRISIKINVTGYWTDTIQVLQSGSANNFPSEINYGSGGYEGAPKFTGSNADRARNMAKALVFAAKQAEKLDAAQ